VEVIEVYFLLVGHTHGQIDQFFSRFALFLSRLPAKTLPELCWSLYHAYNRPSASRRVARNPRKAQPEVRKRVPVKSFVVDSVVDVSSWLLKLNPTKNGTFKGSTKYPLQNKHAFKFELVNGAVQISSKTFSTDQDWTVQPYFAKHLLCRMHGS
jgi:hypothetical protein